MKKVLIALIYPLLAACSSPHEQEASRAVALCIERHRAERHDLDREFDLASATAFDLSNAAEPRLREPAVAAGRRGIRMYSVWLPRRGAPFELDQNGGPRTRDGHLWCSVGADEQGQARVFYSGEQEDTDTGSAPADESILVPETPTDLPVVNGQAATSNSTETSDDVAETADEVAIRPLSEADARELASVFQRIEQQTISREGNLERVPEFDATPIAFPRRSGHQWDIPLNEGRTYWIVGTCLGQCSIEVLDESGSQVVPPTFTDYARDRCQGSASRPIACFSGYQRPVVSFSPVSDGRFSVRVVMHHCNMPLGVGRDAGPYCYGRFRLLASSLPGGSDEGKPTQ